MEKKFESLISEDANVKKEENQKQQSLAKVVISSKGFNRYDMSIDYDTVVSILKKTLMVDIEVVPKPWMDFLNNHLNLARDITQEEKVALMREYYPSVLANNNTGGVVTNLLMAKIPVEAFLTEQESAEAPMFWSAGTSDVRKFTSKYPEFFGSRIFTPALKVIEEGGRSFYCVYLCTLSTVLNVLGLSIDDLKKNNVGVSIVDSAAIATSLQTYIPKLEYKVRFMKN